MERSAIQNVLTAGKVSRLGVLVAVLVALEVVGLESTANRVLRNSVFKNGALGIDLVGGTESVSGATQNDPRDPDPGPNGLQNRPALSSARTASGKTIVKGNLASTLKSTFTLRLFSDEPGAEGKTLLSKKAVTTNAEGDAAFGFSLGAAVPAGRFLTATDTGAEGTSEFSDPRQIAKP